MKKCLSILFFAGAAVTAQAQSPTPLPAAKVTVADVSVSYTGAGNAHIKGKATNVSGNHLYRVGVSFNLFDEQGNLVGDATTAINGVEPGQTWAFSADAIVPFVTYKLKTVDAN